jgi:hypothetical protein
MVNMLLLMILAFCEASVHIYSPDQLREAVTKKYHFNAIPASLGNFGNPPYGTSILGRVFWPGEAAELACGALNYIDFTGDPDPVNSPILLLKRGVCHLVQKVRRAQDIGAAAVVIYNTNDDPVEDIVMGDDGTVGNLFIPAYLISKSDGELLLRFLNDREFSTRVAMQLSFEMNHPWTYVEYHIWMSPDQWVVRDFLHNFAGSAKQFGDDETVFTPHYVLWYCAECRDNHFQTDHPDCFAGGKLCAPDPDGAGGISGRDVLYEDLRQLCIYKQHRTGRKWWDYVFALYSACPDGQFTVMCSHRAMEEADVDTRQVDLCVDKSFSGNNHALASNSILEAERDKLVAASIVFYPSIIINNQTYRGDLEYDEVRSAICAGFKSRPRMCSNWDEPDTLQHETSDSTGISVTELLVILGTGMLLLGCCMLGVCRWNKSQMQKEMRREVSQ